jgi:hypothetical protein
MAAALDETRTLTVTTGQRFFFHIRNGRRYPDETGSVFSCAEEAVAHATALALEFAQDGSWEGFSVSVADEGGSEIARVPISRQLAASE